MQTSSKTHSRFEHANPDEIEQLIPSISAPATTDASNHIDDTITPKTLKTESSSSKLPHIDTFKLGADTFAGAAMIIIGTTMYGTFGIVSRLSMLGKKSTLYQSAAALVVAEFGQFIISAVLLFISQGIISSIVALKSITIHEWLLFCIPAVLDSIINNLDFYILQYMDPGSMQVLIQTKMMTTALLWWYWFKQSINKQQWISLLLLCIGSMLVSYPEDENNINNDNNNNNEHSMYVEWPKGPLFVGIQICLSAIGAVYTEWVYINYGRNRSIHIDSLSMYFWGTLSNALQFFYMNRDKDPETHYLFYGFNYWTWLLIVVYIVKGLCISQIINYFSNIVKLFMIAASILVTGFLTCAIFGLNWTIPYLSGLLLAIIAVVMYQTHKKIL